MIAPFPTWLQGQDITISREKPITGFTLIHALQ
jgi:hypothetical protein